MRFIAAFLLLAVPAHALDLESAIRAFESQGKNLETVLREFSFEGVSLGPTTVEELRTRYQVLEEMTEDNDKALGLTQIRGVPKAASFVELSHFNGTLYRIDVLYNMDKVNAAGGMDRFAELVYRKFGRPSNTAKAVDNKNVTLTWMGSKQRAEMVVSATGYIISVIDSGMEAQANDHRARNTDVGF